MLSQSFQDMALIKEVSLPLWGEIFKVTSIPQEETRAVASHDAVLMLLQAQSDNMYLMDALDTLLSLGTEGGRAALELIGRDQGLQLPFLEKEGAREYACRLWLKAASDKDFGRLLLQARLQPQEGGTRRAFREFAGKVGGKAVQFGKDLLVQAIAEICKKTQRGEVVEVFEYQGDPVCQWVILRGDLIRQQLQVKDRKTGLLIYRPAISDLVRFDTSNGRLGVATRSPSFMDAYKRIFGRLLGVGEDNFAGDAICDLKRLQEEGGDLFLPYLNGSTINRVEVVNLQWQRGDQERLILKSRDCFETLEDLQVTLQQGELVEAKLKFHITGQKRNATALIKPPNQIDINPAMFEGTVESLLRRAGLKGNFTSGPAQFKTLWDLDPWRLPDPEWRRRFRGDFDRNHQTLFKPVQLDRVQDPNHLDLPPLLEVSGNDRDGWVGTYDDPTKAPRVLTISDVSGHELDFQALGLSLQKRLGLAGPIKENWSGIMDLGRCTLAGGDAVALFLVFRRPSQDFGPNIRAAVTPAQPVLLVPERCQAETGLPELHIPLPFGPFRHLKFHIFKEANLVGRTSGEDWILEYDLVMDIPRAKAYFRTCELQGLKFESYPWTFMVRVAAGQGERIGNEEIDLSKGQTDQTVASAKSDAMNIIRKSLKAAGVDAGSLKDLFPNRGHGYALGATYSAFVHK